MGKHKDANKRQFNKYKEHFAKIKDFTKKGKTNKKHRTSWCVFLFGYLHFYIIILLYYVRGGIKWNH